MVHYSKPVKSNQELIAKWQERGLFIPDNEEAEYHFATLGYHHLSAYATPFYDQDAENSGKRLFLPNSSFNDILDLYFFDRELRLLAIDGLERVEVAVRAQICTVLCEQSGSPFWYTKQSYFTTHNEHNRFLGVIEARLKEEEERLERDTKLIERRTKRLERHTTLTDAEREHIKKDVFKDNPLRYYMTQYAFPKLPPAWMVFEVLTFGELNHFYAGATFKTKKRIAKNLGANGRVLGSWLQCLHHMRNLCAHHNRLWNKEHGHSPIIPKSQDIYWLKMDMAFDDSYNNPIKRTYILLVILQVLLYTIDPNSTWAKRLKKLMEKYPTVPKNQMGMPEEWYTDPFWEKALAEKKKECDTDESKDVQ